MRAARWLRRAGHQRFRGDPLRGGHGGARLDAGGMAPQRKAEYAGRISGCVAGLVAITPASGFVKPMPALLIGFAGRHRLLPDGDRSKQKFGYDDTLDAFGVHGMGGTLGAILTGVFATNLVNDGFKDSSGKLLPLGWVDGHAGQIVNQLIAVAVSWGIAIVGTIIIIKICDVVLGVRVPKEQEVQGLDISLHGEEGYILES
jgi:Amt family ammonium transporter